MHRRNVAAIAATLVLLLPPALALAQDTSDRQPFSTGNPLGLPVVPSADAYFEAISSNVKVYGSIYSAESCSYDAVRDVIVVPNQGVPQRVQENDAWISFINRDGSVHTARWIGIQSPSERRNLLPPLVLNDPLGSDIVNGVLYVADRDGGASDKEPGVAVIRRFVMETGLPTGDLRIDRSPWINDIAVANDGTVYATQTGDLGDDPDPATWRVWKVTPDGTASVFVQGTPLLQPNGISFDPRGNIVVVNYGNADVLTFSSNGELIRTEHTAQPGNDGLVILPDGTKFVSSVRHGGVSRIRPGEPAVLIAQNIPSPASMCFDAGANQLVIPMNQNNALAFVPLD